MQIAGFYGPNILRGKEVNIWCEKFQDGRTNLKGNLGKKRGRPKILHTDGNCSKVGFSFIRNL